MGATRLSATLLVSASALLPVGCATMEPGRGFDQVQRDVRERTGADVRWDRGTPEDLQARGAWRDLLKRELTADSAVQVALLNNRKLTATYEELDIAQADLVRAGLLRNPVFSGEVRFATSGGGTGINLDLTGDFLDLVTMPLRKSRAGAAFEAARARVTRAAVDTAFEARAAFFEFQAAEQTLELRQTVERASAASSTLAERLRAAGNITELDQLNERSFFERSRLEVESARARVAQARERLNAALGLWGPDTGWHASARLPEPPDSDEPADALERSAVAASLRLAEARAEVDIAAASAQLVEPLRWLQGSELGAAAEREVEGGWSVGPSFSIPLPIFDSGQASAAESAARLRQAAARYYAEAVEVRASARAAAAAVASAHERLTRHTTVLMPLQARLVEQTQLQYNAMQVSAFQLLQAKRDQVETAASMIAVTRDYWTARAAAMRVGAGGSTEGFGSGNAQRDETTSRREEGAH